MHLFPKSNHIHEKCIDAAQEQFERNSSSLNKRPGAHVRDVLDILLGQHRAFSAYEIVEILKTQGKVLRAIQVYRALDTLIELGNVHRIESKNAFIACHVGEECKQPQLLICQSCEQVAEINSDPIQRSIDETAVASGFVLQGQKIELLGLCPSCAV